MAKKIVVTSGKGGVGKTTVTANLGLALARMGKRVVLIDVDFGLNNLDVVLGVENNIVYDMADILDGRCRAKQALIQHKNYKNLFILSSDGLKSYSDISGQNIKLVIESFSSTFDYVILDSPAGIDVGFHRAITSVDQAIIVATPNLTSIRDASKVVTILKSYKLDYVGLVVNKVRWDLIAGNRAILPNDMKSILKIDLLGVLPDEDDVFLTNGRTLPKKSDSYRAYKMLAYNLDSGKRKIFDETGRYLGFFGSIRRSIKGNI